jgi:hypothetical protein
VLEGIKVYIRYGVGLAMFAGVRGWRWSNTVKYIGDTKVDGSIHERGDSIYVEMFDIWLWLVWYDSNTSSPMTNSLRFDRPWTIAEEIQDDTVPTQIFYFDLVGTPRPSIPSPPRSPTLRAVSILNRDYGQSLAMRAKPKHTPSTTIYTVTKGRIHEKKHHK